jgi:zinc transporter 9
LLNKHVTADFSWSTFIVLVVALVVESATLVIAVKELKGGRRFSKKVFAEADPVTLAVVYEDGAAVLGVLIALASQALVFFTGNGIYDAIGGIFVGAILGILAVVLIAKNHHYIIGKSINEETKEAIIELMLVDPCIENIIDFKSVAVDIGKYRIYASVEWNGTSLYGEIYEAGDLKEEFDTIKDDFKEFTKLMFRTTDRIPRLVGARIDHIEKGIVERFPEILYVDIEIN